MFGVQFTHITRKDALRLCLLRDCSVFAREAGYTIPVAVTSALANFLEDDLGPVVRHALKATWTTADLRVFFSWKNTRLKVEMTCEQVGSPPCLTIMYPDEF